MLTDRLLFHVDAEELRRFIARAAEQEILSRDRQSATPSHDPRSQRLR